jgi:hypothetical protein
VYILPHGIKKDPIRRWQLSDRVFFGRGACHILAGVFLERFSQRGFEARWIAPNPDFPGTHIFVTDGRIAFDYHGYSDPERLAQHHADGWRELHPGWSAHIETVRFSLLNQDELNSRKMLGPAQYLHNPLERAHRFIDRFEAKRLELEQAR